MVLGYHGVDHFGIVGKTGDEIPNPEMPLPAGYIYCPHCSKITKLGGVTEKVWFGTCQSCGARNTYRPGDMAFATIKDGYLLSCGFEERTFRVAIPDQISYAYVR